MLWIVFSNSIVRTFNGRNPFFSLLDSPNCSLDRYAVGGLV